MAHCAFYELKDCKPQALLMISDFSGSCGCQLPSRQSLSTTTALQMVDVGCGIGGSSRHIARRLGCAARGITLSPVQVPSPTYAQICGYKSSRILTPAASAVLHISPQIAWSLLECARKASSLVRPVGMPAVSTRVQQCPLHRAQQASFSGSSAEYLNLTFCMAVRRLPGPMRLQRSRVWQIG